MSKKPSAISLASLDDIFNVDAPIGNTSERIIEIPLDQIHDFKDHPFQIRMNDEMQDLINSIAEYGVLEPGIARPRKEGGYELVSGHRRKFASKESNLPSLPLIIREMDDDTATILMVHSNKQRENILPSERAWALKMLLDALNRRGQRNDMTSSGIRKKSAKSWSIDEAMAKSGMKKTKIYDFISLTKLTPVLMQMVDDNHLMFTAAVQVSCLEHCEQDLLYEAIVEKGVRLSLSQAMELRKLGHSGGLSKDAIASLLTNKLTSSKTSIPLSKVQSFFPSDYTPDQIEQVICKLVEEWSQENYGDET